MASMTLPQTFEVLGASGHVLRYCLYGPEDGSPAIFHGGTPSTRFRRPRANDVASHTRLHHLVLDRPGYGGSTRRPGRTVADAVKDTQTLADAHGWSQFAVFGGSGGGPHALACAALLPDRVTRCAVVSGIKPADSGQPIREEAELRTRLSDVAAEILAKIHAGGPEMPGEPGPPARSDPDAMARIRATFIDSMDGWVDDSIALNRPWGFDPRSITVPVGIWHGTKDRNVSSDHAEWLLATIPAAQDHEYLGGHVPSPAVSEQIYHWLAS